MHQSLETQDEKIDCTVETKWRNERHSLGFPPENLSDDDEYEKIAMDMNISSHSKTRSLDNSVAGLSMDHSARSSVMGMSVSGEFTISPGRSASIVPITPHRRKGNDLSQLTINKLNYDHLELHGREKELAIIGQCWDHLVNGSVERSLLMISGLSGTGKTKLAETLETRVKRRKGLYVRGHFDFNQNNKPYSGIASACGEICGAILDLKRRNPKRSERICEQVKDELGSELKLLVKTFPVLNEVVDVDLDQSFSPDASDGSLRRLSFRPSDPIMMKTLSSGPSSSSDSMNQFRFAFLRFMRVISRHFSPLVVVLDDLQWADPASLDLLQGLLADRKNSKIMVVGAYRFEEVDENNALYLTMESLRTTSKRRDFELTTISIANLDIDAVHGILVELLSLDRDDVRGMEFAELCLRKTEGNPFFLLHFLNMLEESGMLVFNLGTLSWTWSSRDIESSSSASDNVLELVKAKIMDLAFDLIEILQIAACLGSTFSLEMLRVVWENDSDQLPNQTKTTLQEQVETLVEKGYFIKRSGSPCSYCWEHQRIHSAALSMIPEGQRASFGCRIGKILFEELDDEDLESSIFTVVNLLNGDTDGMESMEREDLAILNYQACERAIATSAFAVAAEYATKGIELLSKDSWEGQYFVTLHLYSIGAKSEGFIGNFETMERYCMAVLSRTEVPIEDKFDVYFSWVDSIMQRGQIDVAKELLLEVLRSMFDCHFPYSTARFRYSTMSNFSKVKSLMKSLDASTLPKLNNRRIEGLMKLLDKLAICFHLVADKRMAVAVFRSLKISLREGYSECTPVAFAMTGAIFASVTNDLQGGMRYGQEALALLKKIEGNSTAARTRLLVYAFIFPWTYPILTV